MGMDYGKIVIAEASRLRMIKRLMNTLQDNRPSYVSLSGSLFSHLSLTSFRLAACGATGLLVRGGCVNREANP